ncbi:hypothetical protein KP509_35G026900 [Ceratopteris richardii]|uniref:Uncharacterized protein n=1 Tax=Ceratopteris richardii TaxID=49495 RepID=A0A8T2QE13_CERRI|nr:hypothetical protein KP509_35G026900 [Ceratopteris richardii]
MLGNMGNHIVAASVCILAFSIIILHNLSVVKGKQSQLPNDALHKADIWYRVKQGNCQEKCEGQSKEEGEVEEAYRKKKGHGTSVIPLIARGHPHHRSSSSRSRPSTVTVLTLYLCGVYLWRLHIPH